MQPALFTLCAGNELFYCLLYLFHFSEGPLGRRRGAGREAGGGPGLPGVMVMAGRLQTPGPPPPSPAPLFLCIARAPFRSWLCGSFPSGALGHRPCRRAQVSHQCGPPGHSGSQHGRPGRGGPSQEEMTPEPPAPGRPPALGSLAGPYGSPLPPGRAQATVFLMCCPAC